MWRHLKDTLHRSCESVALSMANKVVSLGTTDAQVYLRRGFMLQAQGETDSAFIDFTKAIELDPNYAEAYCARGELYTAQRKLKEALQDLEKAISLNDATSRAYYCRGVVLHTMGQLSQALESYTAAIGLPSDVKLLAQYYRARGSAHTETGSFDQAVSDYSRAIELNPEQADAWFGRANALMQAGRLEEAAADYTASIQRRPEDSDAFARRARARYRLRDFGAGLQDSEEAIRLDSRNAAAWSCRGWCLFYTARAREAISSFRTALEIKADYEDAKAGLSWAFATCRDEVLHTPESAKEALEYSSQLQASTILENWFKLCILAAAYANSGQYDEATEAANASIECAPVKSRPGLQQMLKGFAIRRPLRERTFEGN